MSGSSLTPFCFIHFFPLFSNHSFVSFSPSNKLLSITSSGPPALLYTSELNELLKKSLLTLFTCGLLSDNEGALEDIMTVIEAYAISGGKYVRVFVRVRVCIGVWRILSLLMAISILFNFAHSPYLSSHHNSPFLSPFYFSSFYFAPPFHFLPYSHFHFTSSYHFLSSLFSSLRFSSLLFSLLFSFRSFVSLQLFRISSSSFL